MQRVLTYRGSVLKIRDIDSVHLGSDLYLPRTVKFNEKPYLVLVKAIMLAQKSLYKIKINNETLFLYGSHDTTTIIPDKYMKQFFAVVFKGCRCNGLLYSISEKDYNSSFLTTLFITYNKVMFPSVPTVTYKEIQHKTRFVITPLLGISTNKVSMVYKDKSKYTYRQTLVPIIGLTGSLWQHSRVGVEFDLFYSNKSASDTMGVPPTGDFIPYVNNYYAHTVNLDTRICYGFLHSQDERFSPYVFIGPTIEFYVRPNYFTYQVYAADWPKYNIWQRYEVEVKENVGHSMVRIGFNAGIGFKASISKNLSLNTLFKYVQTMSSLNAIGIGKLTTPIIPSARLQRALDSTVLEYEVYNTSLLLTTGLTFKF